MLESDRGDAMGDRHRRRRAETSAALFVALVMLAPGAARAQRAESSQQLESERHAAVAPPRDSDVAREPVALDRSRSMPLARRVFGWLPYWIASSSWQYFDWSALSTVGFFSYEVDTATGGPRSLRGWPAPGLRDIAHAHGVAFVLTVTNFGEPENTAVLAEPARRTMLVDSLVDVIVRGGGDGVNVDFEVVPRSMREGLVLFMRELSTKMHGAIPGAEVSMAIPAVDWASAFDVAALGEICDYLVMMGYDYHWSGSPSAGPVAPLAGESRNVTRSVDDYLALGLAPRKLLLGVPWYGFDWPTVDSLRGSQTMARGTAILYGTTHAEQSFHERQFDAATSSPWYGFNARGQWYQVWYEDSTSLALKYRLVNDRGLGGIGIWALGYQLDVADVWQGIHQAFDRPTLVDDDDAPVSTSITLIGDELRIEQPREEDLRVEIYSSRGELLARLFDGRLGAGTHWLRLDDVPPGRGVAFVRVGRAVAAICRRER
jgi:spore germination protein YaaH